MSTKKKIERYKQLRILISRAKEDADRWGTNEELLILQGIRETSAHDYTIYDEAYKKFVRKRMRAMSASKIEKAKEEEKDKKKSNDSSSGVNLAGEELQLSRIADALERLADILEKDIK